MEKSFLNRIKISHVYFVYVIALLIIAVFVVNGARESERSIEETQKVTEDYVEAQRAINELMSASDYLTEQCRAFVVTGDTEKAHLYQEEIEINKRRDRALSTLEEVNVDDNVYRSLKSAMKESNDLAETEYYAMLLAAEGNGIDREVYKNFTGDAKLTAADKKLSDEEKIQKAVQLVFDDKYNDKKNTIREDVDGSLDKLVKGLRRKELNSYNKTVYLSGRDHFMLMAVLFATLLLIVITTLTVILPVKRSAEEILKNEPMPATGSAEFYTLAEAYNNMLDESQKHQEKLSYEATHDELTGLYNRKMFEQMRDELDGEQIGMLILDVDHFKEVNDTYGHEAGDKVLKKVGKVLQTSFRLEDCVCRIGGDEFAVIMRQMDSSLKSVVRDKILMVHEKLRKKDDLPPVTLSIGAAFSDDEGREENLFKKADKALYSIKGNGRDGYAFYSEL